MMTCATSGQMAKSPRFRVKRYSSVCSYFSLIEMIILVLSWSELLFSLSLIILIILTRRACLLHPFQHRDEFYRDFPRYSDKFRDAFKRDPKPVLFRRVRFLTLHAIS